MLLPSLLSVTAIIKAVQSEPWKIAAEDRRNRRYDRRQVVGPTRCSGDLEATIRALSLRLRMSPLKEMKLKTAVMMSLVQWGQR